MTKFNQDGFFPVIPIRNSVLYPGLSLPLRIGRSKSIAAIEAAKAGSPKDIWVLAVTQKNEKQEGEATAADLYRVGTLVKVEKMRGSTSEGYQIVVRGGERFEIEEYREEGGFIRASGFTVRDVVDVDEKTADALTSSLKKIAQEVLNYLPTDTEQLAKLVEGIEDPSYLTHLCAGNLDIALGKKQEILEMASLKNRVLTLLELMQDLKNSLKVQGEIREKLGHKLGKFQRDSILREQMKTIKEELGESDSSSSRDDYHQRIADAKMPPEVEKTANEELKRLEAIGNSSPESHVIRNYIDLLCSMPWNVSAAENSLDLDEAKKSLDLDHYGLDKIKKRIVQHLAVMKLKKSTRGQILLFVGPPGVGKTSLGQSIAKALGRKFVRGSVGGIRDDAEIRGHRRTYVGAMPGRIIQGIKRSGQNNPVFMLDEIDKLARGYSGDPASALLEVLDPEQNATFLDHYLDVPFDLSKVFFIATANSLESIPGPLLDRMEVIDLSGYTTAEKLHIAKTHLIPKELVENGLTPQQLEISDEALMGLITNYTREAGVRSLQRKIASVLRGSTEKVLAKDAVLPIRVQMTSLEEIIGPERYVHEVAERIVTPGVVTGLAWTPQGGEILFIESSLMPGNGKLILTGQLGDVMKESAQIALSLVRSKIAFELNPYDDKKDLHIHVPAGGIPKDGPSAGITLLTTIASLFSGRSVSPKLAMTGEITLRGAVMPVGGVKEKVIAAHRAGIERIILSKRNKKDLDDVPEEVRAQLKFDFVDTAAEVLKIALGLDIVSPTQRLLPSGAPEAPPALV